MDKNKISDGRKALFYIGKGLIILGVILFLSVFVSAFTGNAFDGPPPFHNAIIGFIMIFIGGLLENIGRSGLAGAGVILDPEKAREDLRPHSKAAGGMINDALEEVDILKKDNKEIVKVRCLHCKALNEESAKFCSQCGKEI